MAQLAGPLSSTPKILWIQSRSGDPLRLWVQFPVGRVWEASDQCFSHRCVSLQKTKQANKQKTYPQVRIKKIERKGAFVQAVYPDFVEVM